MEENILKKLVNYLKGISIVSLLLGIIYQLAHLKGNVAFFSYSNAINDSVNILIYLTLVFFAVNLAVWIFIFSLEKIKNVDSNVNHFITLLILYIFLYVIFNKEPEENHATENFIVQFLDAVAIISFYILLLLLTFFTIQVNLYNTYFWYYKKHIKHTTEWTVINIFTWLLLIPITILIKAEISWDNLYMFLISLVALLVIWNKDSKENYLDYSRLLSTKYTYGFLWFLLVAWIIISWSGDNYQNKNICFHNDVWEKTKIEYMNDKYIFTKSGSEVYKNDVNKFISCKK